MPNIILVFILTACNELDREANIILDRAESVMTQHPDSALCLLNKISPANFEDKRTLARYAVLLTQAKDKNDVLNPSDTLINKATAYFETSQNEADMHYRMLANYYRGRVNFLAENYSQSIEYYFLASEYANELSDSFWQAMSYRGLADVYAETFNSQEQLLYAKKELECFQHTDKQNFLDYAWLDLALAYSNCLEHDSAENVCEKVLELAVNHDDMTLYIDGVKLMAKTFFAKKQFDKSIKTYLNVLQSGNATLDDSLMLAAVYAEAKMPHKAIAILDSVSDSDSFIGKEARYSAYKELGKTAEALSELEKTASNENKYFRWRIGQNLTSNVIDNYKIKREQAESELRITQLYNLNIIIVSSIIVVFILVLSIYIFRRKAQKLNQKYVFAEQLEELVRNDSSQEDKSKKIINYLADNQYKILEEICISVSTANSGTKQKQKISKYIDQLLSSIEFDCSLKDELIQRTNLLYDNIYDDFVSDLQKLTAKDQAAFLLFVNKFSTTAICMLLKEETATRVYEIKRRLKYHINKLPEPNRSRYLNRL